jgi:hypothetical protein
MKPQDLIYSKVALPTSQFEEMSKLFLVKDIDVATGAITAFLLSSKLNKKNLPGNYYLPTDKVNQLRYSSVVQTGREFVFPADWEMRVMKGHIDDATFAKILASQELYKKDTNIEVVTVNESMSPNVQEMKNRIAELQDNFQRDPKTLIDYLAFKSKFYHYSLRNTMMIDLQNPYATFVGSRSFFKKAGYDISPEHLRKGIEILRPETVQLFRRDGRLVKLSEATPEEQKAIRDKRIDIVTKTNYWPTDVYDISQTTMPKEEYPKYFTMGENSDTHHAALQDMIQLSESTGVPVSMQDLASISLRGFYDPRANEITLNNKMEDTQALGVMCHEYAHAVLHQTSKQPTVIKEFEAEALGYMLQEKFHLPPREGSVEYMVGYLNKAQNSPDFNMDASLGRIDKQLRFIGNQLQQLAQAAEPSQKQGQEPQRPRGKSKLEQAQDRTRSISENFQRDL